MADSESSWIIPFGCRNNSFDIPSATNSIIEHIPRQSEVFGPFSERPSFSSKSNQMIISTVSLLLFSGSPSAIFGRIRTIIINAVQRMLRGRFQAHIFKKQYKIYTPTSTDDDASSSIFRIIFRMCIQTTIQKSTPRRIFGGCMPAMFICIHNSRDALISEFATNTSATFN